MYPYSKKEIDYILSETLKSPMPYEPPPPAAKPEASAATLRKALLGAAKERGCGLRTLIQKIKTQSGRDRCRLLVYMVRTVSEERRVLLDTKGRQVLEDRDQISVAELGYLLGGEIASTRLGVFLVEQGWRLERHRRGGTQTRLYVKPRAESPSPEPCAPGHD